MPTKQTSVPATVDATPADVAPSYDNHPMDAGDINPFTGESFAHDSDATVPIDDTPEAVEAVEAVEAAEPEAVEAAEPEAAEPHMIPKFRMDQQTAKVRQLEEQLGQYQRKEEDLRQASEFDFAQREKDYMDSVLDGDTDKAVAIRAEINNAHTAVVRNQIMSDVQGSISSNNAQTVLQAAADRLQQQHPQFDPNGAKYDEGMTNEALSLRDAFMDQGYETDAALERAVNVTLQLHNQAPAAAKPRVGVAQKAAMVNSQPPALHGESSSAHGVGATDVTTMSEEDFYALPESTLARLRGDMVQ
jgi:hypothetical protein